MQSGVPERLQEKEQAPRDEQLCTPAHPMFLLASRLKDFGLLKPICGSRGHSSVFSTLETVLLLHIKDVFGRLL